MLLKRAGRLPWFVRLKIRNNIFGVPENANATRCRAPVQGMFWLCTAAQSTRSRRLYIERKTIRGIQLSVAVHKPEQIAAESATSPSQRRLLIETDDEMYHAASSLRRLQPSLPLPWQSYCKTQYPKQRQIMGPCRALHAGAVVRHGVLVRKRALAR